MTYEEQVRLVWPQANIRPNGIWSSDTVLAYYLGETWEECACDDRVETAARLLRSEAAAVQWYGREGSQVSKHTEGPWAVDAKKQFRIIDANGTPVAVAGDRNAHLIAAAPELLEALRKMERIITELYPGHVEPEPEHLGEYQAVWASVMDSRAAIAKAEGRTAVKEESSL